MKTIALLNIQPKLEFLVLRKCENLFKLMFIIPSFILRLPMLNLNNFSQLF